MQPFRTMYRVAVMGATLAIVAMGWRLYGPPAAEVKSLALRGLEHLQHLLQPAAEKRLEPERPAEPPLLRSSAPGFASPPPLLNNAASRGTPENPLKIVPAKSSAENGSLRPQSVAPTASDDRLKSLLARLAALGVEEPQLVAWGDSGQLFRCYCRAAWGQSPQFSRHFESVAAEPETAVEQVVAQIDGWRIAERAEQR